jgi:hypothetical protein
MCHGSILLVAAKLMNTFLISNPILADLRQCRYPVYTTIHLVIDRIDIRGG